MKSPSNKAVAPPKPPRSFVTEKCSTVDTIQDTVPSCTSDDVDISGRGHQRSLPNDEVHLPARFRIALENGGDPFSVGNPVDVTCDITTALKWARGEIAELKRADRELYGKFLEIGSRIHHIKHYNTSYEMELTPDARGLYRRHQEQLACLPDRHLLDSSVISLPDFLTRHTGLSPKLTMWTRGDDEDEDHDYDEADEEESYEDDVRDVEPTSNISESQANAMSSRHFNTTLNIQNHSYDSKRRVYSETAL